MTDHILASEVMPNGRQSPSHGEVKASTGLSLIGDNAYREISSKLRGYPAAQRLSQEVYDFYGNYLSYIESWDFTSTIYALHLQHDPIALKSAQIQLQLGTDRIAESLAHELLHLRMPMVGFPLGELVEVPFQLDHHAQSILGMCHWVVNIVHHEIFFHRFMALGFDKKNFLAQLVTPMDYRKLFKPKPQDASTEEVDFPRWCIEYVKHWVTVRHGGSGDCLRYAQDALDWGSQLHPELKQTVAEIGRWFEAGTFKDPHQYPRQVNLLLDFMRIPRFTGWVILELSEPGKPRAVRLDREGIHREVFNQAALRELQAVHTRI
jgi:hypothetical protein